MEKRTKVEINFRTEINDDEKERMRELIEDVLGVEILSINMENE